MFIGRYSKQRNLWLEPVWESSLTIGFLNKEEPLEQLLRRIDNIIEIKSDTEVTQSESSEDFKNNGSESDYEESDTEVGGNTKTPTSPKDNTKWWDGYDKQEFVILDDFRGSQMQFNELLRLLDRYQHRVEFKGGSRQFDSPNIIITSINHPKDPYGFLDKYTRLVKK